MFGGMVTLVIARFIERYKENSLRQIDLVVPLFCFGIFFFLVYMVIIYFKNVPNIKLDKEKVIFNNRKIYYWKDLDKIEFTGRQPFKFILEDDIEGAMLQFKNGDKKYIFDDMYSNSWEMKSFIEQEVLSKKESSQNVFNPNVSTEILYEEFEFFKSNQFITFRGLILWGMPWFVLFSMVPKMRLTSTEASIFFITFLPVWISINSFLFYYFGISDTKLMIKNHNFFWIKKTYELQDIREVVFESYRKAPDSLRVITKDFRTKRYPAATLSSANWLALKNALKSKGIVVRTGYL